MAIFQKNGLSRGASDTSADILFTDEVLTLEDGEFLDSGFIDFQYADKVQISFTSDSVGVSIMVENKLTENGVVRSITNPQLLPTDSVNIAARFRFSRFKIINTSGGQLTNVGLQVKATYGSSDKASVLSIGNQPVPQSQAVLTQSVLIGQDPFGTYRNSQLNQAGAILVSDFGTEVARGLYNSYSINNRYGRRVGINSNQTPQDLWNGGTVYTGFPTTGPDNIETLSSSSDDVGTLIDSGVATGGSTHTLVDSTASFITDGVQVGDVIINDTKAIHGFVTSLTETEISIFNWYESFDVTIAPEAGDVYRIARATGTGAAVVRWDTPLASDYSNLPSEYVIMNGTTPVLSTGSFCRINLGKVIYSGSFQRNVGEITVRQEASPLNIFAVMPSIGQTSIGAFTVPSGYTCIVKRISASLTRLNGSAGSGTLSFNIMDTGSNTFVANKVFDLQAGQALDEKFVGGIFISAGSDVKFTVDDVSDNGTTVEANIEYFFIKD